MTPAEYDRLNRGLDLVHGIAASALRGEFADAELTCPYFAEVLANLPMTLGLPDGYGLAELDQRIAELRHGLLMGGSDASG